MTYEDLLVNVASEDSRLVVLTAENRASIRTIPDKLGDRFIDTGITEQTMIGISAGLALRGRIPVVHALATFLTMRAFEFIRTDIGIAHLPVKLVGYVPGFLSTANGPTHQAVEDISLMRSIPGMRVFCPADLDDLINGMESVIKDPHPWYIRYPEEIHANYKHKIFKIGKAEVLEEGEDITILTYGLMVHESLKVAELLNEKGYHAGVINMRTLEPADQQSIVSLSKKTKLIVTIEDHFIRGGLYSIVAETLFKQKILFDVVPIALNQHWFKPGLLPAILNYEGFNASRLVHKIESHFIATQKKTHELHPMAFDI